MKGPWHSRFTLGRFLARATALMLAALYLIAPTTLVFAVVPVKPTCQITVNPSSISIGGSVTVKWTSTNATGGAIVNIGNVGPTGSINLLPSSASITTYFGAFTGPGGTSNCQASVAVNSGSTGGGSINGPTGFGTVDATAGSGITNTPVTSAAATPAPTGKNSGLVPCGYGAFTGGNESSSSTGCQACNLAQLIQNLISFAIGITIPIAAALFAYAGVLMFTAADDTGKITKAKGIFKNALIGFLIAITAWIIINTLLHIIFTGSSPFAGGNWFTIECTTANRPVNNKITNVLANLPIVAGNAGTITPDMNGGTGSGVDASGQPTVGGSGDRSLGGYSSGPGGNCPSGFTYDNSVDNVPTCYNATTDTVQDVIPAGSQCPSGSTFYPANNSDGLAASCYNSETDTVSEPLGSTGGGSTGGSRGVAMCADGNTNCSVSELKSLGLSDAEAKTMSCIAITELSGNSNGCSGTGPCGTFQISRTNWQRYAPSECQASNFSGNITAAQNNADCNKKTMSEMLDVDGYQPWTGNNNGVYWNTAARKCVQNYDPTQLDQ